ncbi:MAG TPA: sugar isomerase [Actinobacteria bacterium]|nr:sugar isomerase [Actinomycetota bacterium]
MEMGVREMPGVEYLEAYMGRVQAVLATVDAGAMELFATRIDDTVASGCQVFFIGNGGSASTASHYVNDLVMAYSRTNRVVRAVCLTDNPSLVTGISNDFSFEEIFSYQLRALSRPGDMVVAISASGNSPNLIRAFDFARSSGLTTAAVVGFDGGILKAVADLTIHAPTEMGDYGPAEDAHLIINHAVAGLIRARGE